MSKSKSSRIFSSDVLEGHSRIAQRFSVGFAVGWDQAPKGRSIRIINVRLDAVVQFTG